MNTMHCDCTIETSVNSASFHIGTCHVSIHMEMNGIATHAVRLASIVDLDMVKMCSCKMRILLVGMNHDLNAELVTAERTTVVSLVTIIKL